MADRKPHDILHPELSKNVDEKRRNIVMALVTGVAFAAPLMTSFTKDGLQFSTAKAQAPKKKATKKKATKKKAPKKKATKKKATKKKAAKKKATK